jgi:hypothetical protein
MLPTAAASQGYQAKCFAFSAAHGQCGEEPSEDAEGILDCFLELYNHKTRFITYTIRTAHPASKRQPISFLPTHSGNTTNNKCTTEQWQ